MSFEYYLLNTNVFKVLSKKYRDLMYIGDEFVINEIVRFENLEQDIYNLIEKLKLPVPKRVLGEYKKNARRPDKDWKNMYTNQTQELVEKHFKFYIDLFGYSF